MGIRVVAVDIGSVGPSSKFAWAAFDAPGRQVMAAGTDPQTAVSALAPGLLSGARAALLLEAPMPVPVPDGQPDAWRTLGKARNGEGNRPWSAGVGAAALATGLAQGAWMLRQLAVRVPGLAVTTRPGGEQQRAEVEPAEGQSGTRLVSRSPGRPRSRSAPRKQRGIAGRITAIRTMRSVP
jgi:hypothetical protein